MSARDSRIWFKCLWAITLYQILSLDNDVPWGDLDSLSTLAPNTALMGRYTDASSWGCAPRSPWELASAFRDLAPNKDGPDELYVPTKTDWALTQWAATPGRANRIDLSPCNAWRYRRAYGFSAKIDDTSADNANTAHRVAVRRRAKYDPGGHTSERTSSMCVLARAYSPNAMITDAKAFFVADSIVGSVTDRYGCSGPASHEGRHRADAGEWRSLAPPTLIVAKYGDWR